jgi:hypothetical protein
MSAEQTCRCLVLPPSGEARVDHVAPDDVKAMQKLVGGWLEGVGLPHWDSFMFVDEEGALKGDPLNMRASMLARRPIVGTAIVFGDAGPEVTDVPQEVVREFVL